MQKISFLTLNLWKQFHNQTFGKTTYGLVSVQRGPALLQLLFYNSFLFLSEITSKLFLM